MEKISGILAASPRVKSVDLSEAHPVRPGTPSFGRPVGTTSSRDRFTLSEQAKERAFEDTLGGRNPKEAQQARIAEDVTRKFFETRVEKPPAREVVVAAPPEVYDVQPVSVEDVMEARDYSMDSLEDFLQE